MLGRNRAFVDIFDQSSHQVARHLASDELISKLTKRVVEMLGIDAVRSAAIHLLDTQETLGQGCQCWALNPLPSIGCCRPCREATRGSRHSGGQRQRIAIARALSQSSQVLVLDEAASALGPKTKQQINDDLLTRSSNVTLFAITHREAVTRLRDRVYRIERGTVTLEKNPTRPHR